MSIIAYQTPAVNTVIEKPAMIKIEGIAQRFLSRQGEPTTVFENLWLDIKQGEFVCLIGHSGCGKTTILNILAGLDSPTEGYVIADGREIAGTSLDRAVIFQSHALLPWLTVIENIAFAVKSRWPTWSKAEVTAHAMHYISLVNLTGAQHKRPSEFIRWYEAACRDCPRHVNKA